MTSGATSHILSDVISEEWRLSRSPHSVHRCVVPATVSITRKSPLNLPQSNPSTFLAQSSEIAVDDRDTSCYNFSSTHRAHTHTSHWSMNEPPKFFFCATHDRTFGVAPHPLTAFRATHCVELSVRSHGLFRSLFVRSVVFSRDCVTRPRPKRSACSVEVIRTFELCDHCHRGHMCCKPLCACYLHVVECTNLVGPVQALANSQHEHRNVIPSWPE